MIRAWQYRIEEFPLLYCGLQRGERVLLLGSVGLWEPRRVPVTLGDGLKIHGSQLSGQACGGLEQWLWRPLGRGRVPADRLCCPHPSASSSPYLHLLDLMHEACREKTFWVFQAICLVLYLWSSGEQERERQPNRHINESKKSHINGGYW